MCYSTRRILLTLIAQGDLAALQAHGDLTDLPDDTVAALVASLRDKIGEQITGLATAEPWRVALTATEFGRNAGTGQRRAARPRRLAAGARPAGDTNGLHRSC